MDQLVRELLDYRTGGRVLGRSSQRGVSLIELVIGLVIVGLLVLIGAPSFATFLQNSQIRNASESIQNGLSLARSEAVRRNTEVTLSLSKTSAGADVANSSSWEVGCTTVSTNLTSCPADIQHRSYLEGSKNVTITNTVTGAAGATFATTGQLTFNGYGKVVGLPAANTAVIDIVTSVNGATCAADGGAMRCLRLIVSPAGQVRMCDPALTLTNASSPQAC